MIALLTTYLIIAYVLIPGVLFRVFAGFLVKLRLFQLTKTQEVTFGVLVSIAPLLAANLAVWQVPLARQYPFPYAYGSIDEYKSDYRIAVGLVVSEDPEKLLDPTRLPKSVYEVAVTTIWHRQLRFLCWYFIFSIVEGVVFGWFCRKYGDWFGKNVIYDWFARKILLPNVSEWQVLLTDFSFPTTPKREVQADVLCDGTLYRGAVEDYFLDSTGKLSGLFIKNAERFRRKDYEVACEKAGGEKVQLEQFWRKIPGSNFYIPSDKISNLNVRFPLLHPQLDEDLMNYISELLKKSDLPTGIKAEFEDPTTMGTENHEDSSIPNLENEPSLEKENHPPHD